jgi:hypothetical protein
LILTEKGEESSQSSNNSPKKISNMILPQNQL